MTNQVYQDVARFGHFVRMQYDSWASCIPFAMHGHGLFLLEWSLHFRCIQVFVMQNVSGKAGRFQELQFDRIEQHSTSLIVPYGKLYRFGRWTDTCPWLVHCHIVFCIFSIQFESIWSHLRCTKWCAVMSIDIAWLVCNNTGIRVKETYYRDGHSIFSNVELGWCPGCWSCVTLWRSAVKTQNSWICGWQTVHHGNARPGPGNSFKDWGRFQGWRSKMSLDRQKDLLRITFLHVPLEVVHCPHLICGQVAHAGLEDDAGFVLWLA